MRAVIASLARFKIICSDFKVPETQIRIIATEATREALNAKEFIAAVKRQTGLTVEVLPKEEEGKIGAMGIASSFTYVGGLVMDLGGGSTQISWMISREGQVQTSPTGAFSFPYGAAALTRLLDDLKSGKSKEENEKALAKLREDMTRQFLDAYHNLEIPQELIDIARLYGGFQLYLCGGGFRGWGYLLLYQSQVHGHHYPISIINGYKADKVHFESTHELKEIAHTANKIFRVSDRRRAQVPAVAFLVNVLSNAIPFGIKEAQFCQGGSVKVSYFNSCLSLLGGSIPFRWPLSDSHDQHPGIWPIYSCPPFRHRRILKRDHFHDLSPQTLFARSQMCSLNTQMYQRKHPRPLP